MKLAALFAMGTGAALAADFTGTWAGVAKFDSGAPQGVCVSLFEGTGVSGQVAFDGDGGAASIQSGHGDGAAIEFSTANSRFELRGDEKNLKGTVAWAGKSGPVALQSFMPDGRTNHFGPSGFGPAALSRTEPGYTPEALEARLEGNVTLQIEIQPSGAIGPNVRVVKGLGKGLDEKAVECVLHWKFSPPRMDCSSAPSSRRVEILFHLPGK